MQEPGDGEAWPECSSSPPTFLVSVNRTPLALFSWGLLLPRRKLGDGEMCRGLELRRRCSHGKRAGGTGSVACLREKSECRHTHEEETHARGGDRGMGESIVVFHADPAAMLILQPAWRPPLCTLSLSFSLLQPRRPRFRATTGDARFVQDAASCWLAICDASCVQDPLDYRASTCGVAWTVCLHRRHKCRSLFPRTSNRPPRSKKRLRRNDDARGLLRGGRCRRRGGPSGSGPRFKQPFRLALDESGRLAWRSATGRTRCGWWTRRWKRR
jgi:hypothetical protein